MGGPAQVLEYLARYTHRTAISNERIVSVGTHQVVFKVRANDHGDKRVVKLGGVEFVRRFLRHVLPKGIKRIRHYGLLAPSKARTRNLAREALQMPAQPLRIGRKFRQGLRSAGKQGIDHPARVRAIQRIQAVRQGQHHVGIRHIQHLSQSGLQPGLFGTGAALGAMTVAARVVLPLAVATGITGKTLTTQSRGAAGNYCPPGFGLGA